MLFSAFLVSLVAAAPAPEEKKPESGDGKVIKILAEHKLYKQEPGQEKEFVGVIQKDAQGGYTILMQAGKAFGKEKLMLYGDAGDPLAPFVGKKVRLFGKQVSGAVGFRTFQHTLPGRLEVLAEKEEGKKEEAKADGKELKISARGFWSGKRGGEAQQLVLRSGEELGKAMGLPAEQAAAAAAKLFKVDALDWKTQMVVVATAGPKPTGGYSVEIQKLTVKENGLTVHWKLNSPRPGAFVTQAFTHPAQAALVERFEGKTVFDPPAPRGGKDDKDK